MPSYIWPMNINGISSHFPSAKWGKTLPTVLSAPLTCHSVPHSVWILPKQLAAGLLQPWSKYGQRNWVLRRVKINSPSYQGSNWLNELSTAQRKAVVNSNQEINFPFSAVEPSINEDSWDCQRPTMTAPGHQCRISSGQCLNAQPSSIALFSQVLSWWLYTVQFNSQLSDDEAVYALKCQGNIRAISSLQLFSMSNN